MYLDFIKDIVNINDRICLVCGTNKYVGKLVKINSELIAIKNELGIIIKKDEDITDINIIKDTSQNQKGIQNTDTLSKSKEKLQEPCCKEKELIDNTSCKTPVDIEEIVVQDSKDKNTTVQIEDRDSYISNDDVEKVGIVYDKKEVNENLSENIEQSKKIVEVKKEETVEVKTENSNEILPFPKPHVKIVGRIDLSKIKDTRKNKKDVQSTSNEVENNKNEYFEKDRSHIERYINGLIQTGKSQEAIAKINSVLVEKDCVGKFRSSLLLKKAQTLSAMSDYENAKIAYENLISYNEEIKSSANNLSHLYTELARLQNLTKEGKDVVLETLKKALKYNPGNNFASTLLDQINAGVFVNDPSHSEEDNELILEAEEISISISKMIETDIKEHKYTNEKIINNGGEVTPSIAKSIYETAKQTKNVDMAERYPVYLEAAKAYSELPIGSYDTQEYLESVAYYAILKGNSLFIKFKKLISDNKLDIDVLTHLKDSSCSYYIESLNLLSNIKTENLLTILSNYLKMNIALINIQKGEPVNLSGQFNKVFFDCIISNDTHLNLIAWTTVVAIGTASPKAWNKLTQIKGGTGGLYRAMSNSERRQDIYAILNRINDEDVNTKLQPGEFLKKSFAIRNNRKKSLKELLTSIQKEEFNIHMLNSLTDLWKKVPDYLDLLSETDLESKNIGDKVIRNLLPYSARQSQIERTNILYQAQRDLELQIEFIDENTTYYGRTFFFSLFSKWRSVIQQILSDKISKTYPILQVSPDPPFLVRDGNIQYVNMIVKNVGESTAEGYIMNVSLKSSEKCLEIKGKNNDNNEIPVGTHIDKRMNLPTSFLDCDVIDISVEISSIYQSKKTNSQFYRFTVELEPQNQLSEEDIVWKDGPKMSGVLFKGRQEIMSKLSRHYLSVERDKPYILYGLTRTGKSSILLNLHKELTGRTFLKDGITYKLIAFDWDLSEASGYGLAKDMWQYLLYDSLYEELDKYLDSSYRKELQISEYPRAKDFKTILQYLHRKKLYPMFFVDEFSHIKILLDSHIINTSFLHTLRQYTLEGLASFIYAGTYDIKELIKNPKYAITGQLVNTVEEQIHEIDTESAEELINVMGDKLIFTEEAIKHIHVLSGDVPYFIQIICKSCGYFAVEKNRKHIGYPELEHVVRILTGEQEGYKNSLVKVLPKSIFQNNLYSPQDNKEVNVLISSICYLNNNKEIPKSVSVPELQELWSKNGIYAYRPKLAESITLLLERKVLVPLQDELIPVYRISVDIFRRWWSVHYPDIKLEITTIQ